MSIAINNKHYLSAKIRVLAAILDEREVSKVAMRRVGLKKPTAKATNLQSFAKRLKTSQ